MNDVPKKQSRSRNALVHGLYAKDVLLPWDSKEDFEKLHEDLILEWRPRDRSEQETILDLALVYWQKRTLWRMRQTAVVKHPFTGDILATKRKSWAGIRKRLRSAAKSGRTLLGVVEAQEAKLFSQVDAMRKKIDAASNREEVKLIEEKIDALMRTMAEHVLPLMQALNQGPNPEQVFDTAYAAEDVEKIVRLEAALDARIAKLMARLVGLKEFKRTPAGGGGSLPIAGG